MLLTTDEETGSLCSREVIADSVSHASAVLVLESAIGQDLKSARKGTSWYRVEVEGRAAHAGLDPERGINALVAAADLVTYAHTLAQPTAGTTVTPTTMAAGTTANTVPAHATLMIDVRAWTSAEQQRVDELIRGWTPPVEGALVHLHGGIDRPAMEPSSSAELLVLAQRAAERIGLGSLGARAVGGASDGNLTAALGVPTLDGLGAVGDGAHADHEWSGVPALAERAALLAALLEDLLQQPA
jgi:glutamate carboxypeptidase